MVDWLWLSKLLILASVARLSLCIHFFPDSDFGGRPVTSVEADAFFKKIDDIVRKRSIGELAAKHSEIGNATIREHDVVGYSYRRSNTPSSTNLVTCFAEQNGVKVLKPGEANCEFTVNSLLAHFRYPTLQVLSGQILVGEEYTVKEYMPQGTSISQLTAKRKQTPLVLPGVILLTGDVELILQTKPTQKKGKKERKSNKHSTGRSRRAVRNYGRTSGSPGRTSGISGRTSRSSGHTRGSRGERRSGSSGSTPASTSGGTSGRQTLTMKGVVITITGKGKMKAGEKTIGTGEGMSITISKKKDEETYGIIYGINNDIVEILNEIKSMLGRVQIIGDYVPTEITTFITSLDDLLSNAVTELTSYTIFGAFNKEKDYQIGASRDEQTINSIQVKKLTFVVSLKGRETLAQGGFAFFMVFDKNTNLFQLIGDAIGGDNFVVNLMKQIESPTWCLLLLTKNITFIDEVKTRVMTECLGDALKNATEPAKVVKGIHFHVEVELTNILDECWKNAPADKPSTFTNITTKIPVYVSLTEKGFDFSLPEGSDVAVEFIKSCIVGLVVGAPKMLTESHIQITRFNYEKDPMKFRVALSVKPSEAYKFIPGTSIGLEELLIDVDRKQVGTTPVYWDIDGSIIAKLGQATIKASIVKRDKKYKLKVAIDALTLADVFGFIDDLPTILKEVGIQDFDLSYEFDDGDAFSLSISGKPLIVGYSDLQIAVKVSKPQSGSIIFTVGMYLNGADFDGLMKAIAGNEAVSLKWLNRLKAVVVFSKTTGTLKNKAPTTTRQLTSNPKSKLSSALKDKTSAKKLKRTPKVKDVVRQRRHVSPHGRGLRKRTPSSSSSSRSTAQTEELKFEDLHSAFRNMKYVNGLTFGIAWTLPADKDECFDNGLCTWLVEYIGNGSTLMISGSITRTSFKLAASLLMDATLFEGATSKLTFKEIKLVMEVGVQLPKFMIMAKMDYMDTSIGAVGNNVLKFTGSIEATPISIQMTFSMAGFVFPTALSRYFAIGNVVLGVGYTITTGLPSFVFGATIWLGELDGTADDVISANSHAIEIKGYFGVNPGRPTENWIYGSINSLTVLKIHEAFKLPSDDVPDVLKTTGFPSGITASFAMTETEVPTVGTIPAGLTIIGTINFFGLECYCKLDKNRAGVWHILIEMSPLNWASGWIQILRSESETDKGPKVEGSFGLNENMVKIKGYINALSVLKASVDVEITSSRTYFKITGYIIPNLVQAVVEFEANYNTGSSTGSNDLFSLKAAIIASEFVEELKTAIKDYITSIHDAAQGVLDIADAAVESAKELFRKAEEDLRGWETSINNWKNQLREQKRSLQEKAQSPPPCSPPCAEVCIPFLDWNSHCWKIWGIWIGCPYWNSCFTKLTDLFCLARCSLSRIVGTVTRWAQQAVLSITMLVAEGARGLLTLAHGVLNTAYGIVKIAEDGVQWIRDGMTRLLELGKSAVDTLFTAFALNHLKLTARITAEFTACVEYDIKVTIDNKPYPKTGDVCLDFKGFMMAFVRMVTDQTDPKMQGISSEAENINEAKGKNTATKNSEEELKRKSSQTTRKIASEERKSFHRGSLSAAKRNDIPTLRKLNPFLSDLPKRTTVPTEEEAEMMKLANEPIPRYLVKNDRNVRSLIQNVPWSMPEQKLPLGYNATSHDDPTVKKKRQLDFGETLSPCDRMKRALDGYSDLTDGLVRYSQSIQESNAAMEGARNARTDKLRKFRSDIETAERKHNITARDSDEAYLVYNQLAQGHEDMIKRSDIAIKREDSYALTTIRRQLNGLLKREKGTNVVQFTELMHANAVQGYKRSLILHPEDAEGEKLLANIKEDLQSILTNEESDLTPMSSRLSTVKKNIITMSTYTTHCQKNGRVI